MKLTNFLILFNNSLLILYITGLQGLNSLLQMPNFIHVLYKSSIQYFILFFEFNFALNLNILIFDNILQTNNITLQ